MHGARIYMLAHQNDAKVLVTTICDKIGYYIVQVNEADEGNGTWD
jgi:hypothetical protein